MLVDLVALGLVSFSLARVLAVVVASSTVSLPFAILFASGPLGGTLLADISIAGTSLTGMSSADTALALADVVLDFGNN